MYLLNTAYLILKHVYVFNGPFVDVLSQWDRYLSENETTRSSMPQDADRFLRVLRFIGAYARNRDLLFTVQYFKMDPTDACFYNTFG